MSYEYTIQRGVRETVSQYKYTLAGRSRACAPSAHIAEAQEELTTLVDSVDVFYTRYSAAQVGVDDRHRLV